MTRTIFQTFLEGLHNYISHETCSLMHRICRVRLISVIIYPASASPTCWKKPEVPFGLLFFFRIAEPGKSSVAIRLKSPTCKFSYLSNNLFDHVHCATVSMETFHVGDLQFLPDRIPAVNLVHLAETFMSFWVLNDVTKKLIFIYNVSGLRNSSLWTGAKWMLGMT